MFSPLQFQFIFGHELKTVEIDKEFKQAMGRMHLIEGSTQKVAIFSDSGYENKKTYQY